MHKNLFLLCPTDCLESVINNKFKQENYFYTSLGNSFVSDIETIENIKELIIKHNIKKIYLILSNDNQIILDALGKQFFTDISGLKVFYREIIEQEKHSKALWQADDHQFSIVSYFLNKKISELQYELSNLFNYSIEIRGKIYNRKDDTFKNIYSNLICLEKHCLN